MRFGDDEEVARLLSVSYLEFFSTWPPILNRERIWWRCFSRASQRESILSGFQNFAGTTLADLLRLNMAIPPATTPNILGILGGDLAGFPNGRRVFDGVFTIELRALAAVTIPLVDTSF